MSHPSPTVTELLEPWVADPDQREQLAHFAGLLARWNAVHNLVADATPEVLVRDHLLDSLAGTIAMTNHGRLLDIGSGAGFPAIPLLVCVPQWRGTLLEPRHKRWAFLKLVVRELGLDAEVLATSYQLLDDDQRDFDLVTSRALGGFAALLPWIRTRLSPTGSVLLWVGENQLGSLSAISGWHVLSSPSVGHERKRLARLQPCTRANRES